MADLTACYFCGDSTVEEYPVIPPRMDPPDDRQRTVALCADCHGKLGTVLGTVVGFLAEGTGAGGPATGPATSGGARDDPDGVWFEEGADAGVTGGAPDAGGTATGGPDASGGGPPPSGGASGGAGAPPPESYRKVLRLLQNREFPVERAEFETVAANAYELSQGEVGAALDAAVDRGLITEDAGTLHRPE